MTMTIRYVAAAVGAALLAGCGVGQAVKDSTVDAAKWAFTTQVKAMNVDLVSRSALNTDGQGKSLSTVVRLYQLKSPQAFEQMDYADFQNDDLDRLQADLLATKDVVLRPDTAASISEPMDEDADYVGVVAFFRRADAPAVWKVVLPRKQWKDTDPVKIVVNDNVLEVIGTKPARVTSPAPQRGAPPAAG